MRLLSALPPAYRQTAAEVIRYLIAGGSITLAAHGLYLLGLALGLSPSIAWAVSFACGTLAGYFIHGRYVFRASARRHHWFSFPATYLLRFLIGEAMLLGLLRVGMGAGWAGFVTNLAMAPLGFVLLRFVLRAEGQWFASRTQRTSSPPTR